MVEISTAQISQKYDMPKPVNLKNYVISHKCDKAGS
jgi:hypothetical protein